MTPDEYTIKEIFLSVGNGHTLYIHDWGNASAKTPIIFLHGGPGSNVQDRHKGVFDGSNQRVIFFDQRGCGKSTPYGSIVHNTTDELVADIEKIARHLRLNKFVLTGGSWGSCLALAYALKYPTRVEAMVLHGVFTGSQREIDWLDKGAFITFFPDVYDWYLKQTPTIGLKSPTAYHYKQIMGKNAQNAKQSGFVYETLEGSIVSLDDRHTPDSFEEYDPSGIRIEMHYMQNTCFMPERYILDNAHKLKMPVWLVQGRYDMVCPPMAAYELNKELPNSTLIWTINGHRADHESWNVQRTILSQWS